MVTGEAMIMIATIMITTTMTTDRYALVRVEMPLILAVYHWLRLDCASLLLKVWSR
jgi:hypothetical protein